MNAASCAQAAAGTTIAKVAAASRGKQAVDNSMSKCSPWIFLLSLLLQATVVAQDAPTYGARDGDPPVLLSNADGQSPYTGIGRYLGRASCTAVFVTTFDDGADAGRAPAYALTNGHCPDFPGPNDVLLDQPPGRGQVTFNYFADTTRGQLVVPVARVAYLTMKGQDIAVLELALRHDQLRARGIEPRPIVTGRVDTTEPIVVVGAPGSSFLQLASCRLDGGATLVLEHVWHWYGFLRNTCLGVAPGSSGSPAMSRRTGRIIGLVNTTTNGGRAPYTGCLLDHPCEPQVGGEISRAETTYITPLLGIDACFPDGRFEINAPQCSLDPGDQVRLTPASLRRVNPRLDTVPVGRPAANWNVAVSGSFDWYRFKIVQVGADDCRDGRGYSLPRSVAQRPLIDNSLPGPEGWWFLCVVGGRDSRQGREWQSLAFPTIASVRVDSVRPRVEPPLTIADNPLAWVVAFDTYDPEVSLYQYKFGRPADTRCEDGSGYRLALVPFIALPKSGRPYVFCAIPYDGAQNPGRLIERLLP